MPLGLLQVGIHVSNAWLSIPVMMLGVAFLVYALVQGWRGVVCRGWPETTGRVLDSNVPTVFFAQNSYKPRVKYEYWVDGTRYQGQRIGFAQPTYLFEDEAWRVANRYPVGGQVAVHYSPHDPSESVLETGPRSWYMLTGLTMLGLVSVAIGIWLARR